MDHFDAVWFGETASWVVCVVMTLGLSRLPTSFSSRCRLEEGNLYSLRFLVFFTLAHRAFCAARMLASPSALSLRFLGASRGTGSTDTPRS